MVISECLGKRELFTVNALIWESQETSVTGLTSQPSSYNPRYLCPPEVHLHSCAMTPSCQHKDLVGTEQSASDENEK